jgi:hypothetical protein
LLSIHTWLGRKAPVAASEEGVCCVGSDGLLAWRGLFARDTAHNAKAPELAPGLAFFCVFGFAIRSDN